MSEHPLFSNLINSLQEVYSVDDISPELCYELTTIATLVTYKFTAESNPGYSQRKVIRACRKHFNSFIKETTIQMAHRNPPTQSPQQ